MTHDEQEKEAINILNEKVKEQDLEYADNFRAAPVNNPKLWAKYKEAFDEGCCGFFDTSIYIDGVQWDIGCNYGH